MKILYIAKVNPQLSGVVKKISDTTKRWEDLDHSTLVYNSFNSENIKSLSLKEKMKNLLVSYTKILYDYEIRKLVTTFQPDIIYWRFGPVPLFQRFNRKIKIIVESNSNIKIERKTRTFMRQLAINLYLKKFNKICTGVIGVTPECIEGFQKIKHKKVVGNGIKLDQDTFEKALRKKREQKEVQAVFIGSPDCPWHGIDKIIKNFKNYPSIRLKVIGYNNYDNQNYENRTPSNVTFEGYLDGDSLANELNKASFALGSFAMERAGMSYSSSLKNRTYLQYALPIIMQGSDIDLQQCPGVFSLPIDFNLEEIKEKINEIMMYSYDLKDFYTIQDLIGIENVEIKRVSFFSTVINEAY